MDGMAGNTMNVNIQSIGGYTPLHMAAINKSHKVSMLLGTSSITYKPVKAFSVLMMDFKADRKIRDNSGKTATSYLRSVITSGVELRRR